MLVWAVCGFLGRYGGVPTNVGSGGGVQPLAVVESSVNTRDAVKRINESIAAIDPGELQGVVDFQKQIALDGFAVVKVGNPDPQLEIQGAGTEG